MVQKDSFFPDERENSFLEQKGTIMIVSFLILPAFMADKNVYKGIFADIIKLISKDLDIRLIIPDIPLQ
jgi:hypothetical protein